MPEFKVEFDVNKLTSEFQDLKNKIEEAAKVAMASLAASTHAQAHKFAEEKLGNGTTRNIYAESLSFEPLSDNLWVVSLDMKKAGWIEDGRKSGFMEELLKGKSAKTSKDGSRYAVIPFEHSKVPSMQTPSAQRFTQEIRSFLKEKKINYKKIEYNLDGSPKLGLLHSFKEGIGKEIYPSPKAKHDVFRGLSIYQSQDKKTGKVTRDVMTFRIISDKHRSEGLWNHPGRAGVFIIEKTYEWALSKLETEIIPEILQSIDRN